MNQRTLYGTVLLLSFCEILNAAEEVTFKYQPVKPGDTQTKSQDFQSTMKLTVKANGAVVNTVEQNSGKFEKRKITALETSGESMTKLKMTYLSATMTAPGEAEAKATPYSGKTYIAEMKNGNVSVTNEAGKPVADEEEVSFVAKDAKSIMKPERFSKLLEGKTLKAGDKVDISEEMAREILGAEEQPTKVDKMSMVLKEIRKVPAGTQGVFSLEMIMASDLNPVMKMTANVKGDTIIAVDTCWPILMAITGPVTIKGSQQKGDAKIDFDGTGEIKVNVNAEYGK